MKKILAMTLVAAMSFSMLAGCGSKTEAPATDAAATEEVTDEAAETTDAEATDAEATGSPAPEWAAYDELIAKIKASTDTVEREGLLHQAEDMLMSTSAVVPIYYYNDIYMQKADVTGVYSNVFGFKYFQFASTPRETLNINLASEPAKLDPALNSSVDGACLVVNSFEGLYTYNKDGALEPAFADSYEVSEDGLTYTFTLKDGLKWSDGSDLTAADFEYSWKRAANPDTAADYAYLFDIIAKGDDGLVNATASEDGKTFTVVLTAPCPYFLDLCAFPGFYPVKQESVEAAADWQTNPGAWCQEAGFVTSGAYTLESWTHNESMVYVKNPNYYRADEVKIEELHFMLSDDDTAIFAAYNSGDLDFIDTVPTDEIAALLENPEFYIIDQLGTYFASFNVNSPIFEGLTAEQATNMRKAISLLIDRGYIAENIGQTGQLPANTFIPPSMMDGNGGEFRANDDGYTYPDEANVGYYNPEYSDANVEEAIALMETAGYQFDESGMLSAETPLTLNYLTNESTGHVAIAEAIQQDLAVIGINVVIDTVEWNVFLEERKAGNFDFARDGWIADYNDPVNMLEMWTSDSGNNNCQFGK